MLPLSTGMFIWRLYPRTLPHITSNNLRMNHWRAHIGQIFQCLLWLHLWDRFIPSPLSFNAKSDKTDASALRKCPCRYSFIRSYNSVPYAFGLWLSVINHASFMKLHLYTDLTGQMWLDLYKHGYMLSRTQSIKGCLEEEFFVCLQWLWNVIYFGLFCSFSLKWAARGLGSEWLTRYDSEWTNAASFLFTLSGRPAFTLGWCTKITKEDVLMNATCTIFDEDSIWHV